MPNLELAGWVAAIAAVAVLVGLVAADVWRYAHRAHNLSRLLATSRAEQSPGPPRGSVSRRGVEISRPAAGPPPRHRQAAAAPSGSVADGTK